MAEQSESIKELALALSKAQSQIKTAQKDATNPFFKSRYADLTSVMEACREALTSNGLAVAQFFRVKDGQTLLVTKLLHNSGQWLEGAIPLVSAKPDPQSIVAATTYFRRASLAAMVGVVPEEGDDDGNSNRATEENSHPVSSPDPRSPGWGPGSPTTKQLSRLFAIAKQAQWSDDRVKDYMMKTFKKASRNDLSVREYDVLCDFIKAHPVGIPDSDGWGPHGGDAA